MSEATGQDELTYRRVHDAPRELVFDCMTKPEHLTHFWGPAGPPLRSMASGSTCGRVGCSRR